MFLWDFEIPSHLSLTRWAISTFTGDTTRENASTASSHTAKRVQLTFTPPAPIAAAQRCVPYMLYFLLYVELRNCLDKIETDRNRVQNMFYTKHEDCQQR